VGHTAQIEQKGYMTMAHFIARESPAFPSPLALTFISYPRTLVLLWIFG